MKMSRDFSFAGLSLVFQPWSFHGLIFALPFLFVSVGASQQPSSPLVDSYESYKRIRASSPFDLQWMDQFGAGGQLSQGGVCAGGPHSPRHDVRCIRIGQLVEND